MPTAFTVASEDYLLTHRLYLYTAQSSPNPQVARFVDFALSPRARPWCARPGSSSWPSRPSGVPPRPARRPEYVRLTAGARRLSSTFRFELGSSAFDSRAQRDLDRVVEYLRRERPERQRRPRARVRRRHGRQGRQPAALAWSGPPRWRRRCAQRGIAGVTVAGLGSALPVADNASEDGRRRNRRVEVWLAGR